MYPSLASSLTMYGTCTPLNILEYPIKLIEACCSYEHVDAEEVVVFWCDDQGVPGPDHASGSQSCRLGEAKFLSWSVNVC